MEGMKLVAIPKYDYAFLSPLLFMRLSYKVLFVMLFLFIAVSVQHAGYWLVVCLLKSSRVLKYKEL